jgi:hypothetical protein
MKNIVIVILAVLVMVLFFRQCQSNKLPFEISPPSYELPQPDTVTVVQVDTLYPPPQVVTLSAPIPLPEKIYLTVQGERIVDTLQLTESSRTAQVYTDTFITEDLDVYYTATVSDACQLISNDIDYQLKVPKEIVRTETITIKEPIPVPNNQVLLTGEVGSNWQGRTSIAPGIQFVDRRGWAIGYSYDVINQQHSVSIGIRLLQY